MYEYKNLKDVSFEELVRVWKDACFSLIMLSFREDR